MTADLPVLPTVGALREFLGIKSTKQLGFYLLSGTSTKAGKPGPYRTYTIPKRSGSARTICAPVPGLKVVQRKILSDILYRLPTHDAVHGFVPGRSPLTNALPHVGRPLVVKFDIKDFFPSIRYFRVVGMFANLGYHCDDRPRFSSYDDSTAVAATLARLCCFTDTPKKWGVGALAQGAPTSPALANYTCRRLDKRLSGVATRLGGVYTRYADDLTFSFPEAKGVGVGWLNRRVTKICAEESFVVHPEKFRVFRSCRRQEVTGLVVNARANAPREMRHRFRAILHNCKKNGVAAESRGDKRFVDYLHGYAAYLNMVDSKHGPRILSEVKTLLGKQTHAQ